MGSYPELSTVQPHAKLSTMTPSELSHRGRPRLPSTMKRLSKCNAAWVAGIVEGEGSIGRVRGELAVWSNDRELLERLQDLTGVGRLYKVSLTAARRAAGSRSVTYRWLVTRRADLSKLYPTLLPWMLPRRAAAMSAALQRIERT